MIGLDSNILARYLTQDHHYSQPMRRQAEKLHAREPRERYAARCLRGTNSPSISTKRLGAIFLDDWKAVRIEGQALRRLAWQSKT